MASLEHIVAATENLAGNSHNLMGGSVSRAEESLGRVSDVNKDSDGCAPAVVVSKRVVKTVTAVDSTFDSNNGLVDSDKEKIGVGNLSSVLNDGTSVLANGIDVTVGADGSSDGVLGMDEKIKGGEYYCMDNEGSGGSDCKKMNGNGRNIVLNVDGDEKLVDGDHGFRVGDLVWGKIKSHPWWPGQVYDPSDASEFAVKYSQEGRLLVAFFGDGSCSWCLPSQLIPFGENFKEMSTDSSSKSFLNAIQRASDEISRLVESRLTCKCIPLEKRDGLARPVVANAGLKAGVLAPEVDIHRFSVPNYGPAEILAKVMHFAKAVSVESVLELAVLRSWFSAFYRARGGFQLPVYREPIHIEGLEDKNQSVPAVTDDFSVPIEVPILGPLEDDSPTSAAVNTSKSQASSEDKIYHRRKQKSVAELMAENNNVKPKIQKRAKVKAHKDLGKSASTLKRKNSLHGEEEEDGCRGASSTVKTGSMRMAEVSESPKITNENVLSSENSGDRDVGGVNEGTLLEKPKQIEVSAAENTGEAKEESETVSTPRERKKSKYLSPPYTYPIWRIGNSSTKADSKSAKIAKPDQVVERMTKASSPPLSKSVDEASDEKLPNGLPKGLDASVSTSPPTVENDQRMTVSASDVNVPVNELLLEIQFAAVDPLYLNKEGSFDMVWAFVSALRSSTYFHGPNYKAYQKCRTGRKRKSLPSRHHETKERAKSAHQMKSPKAVRTEGKPDASKSKKAAEKNDSSCLVLTFTPGYPLPSKEEILKLFAKFGKLKAKKTNVFPDSHSVQIVYMKDSDAEAAFKSSVNESPFGVENVNYWLQHSSPHGFGPKISPPCKRASEIPEASQPTDDFMSDVRVIRQKVEIMTAILENYHTKFSVEDKSSLKDEIKHLMDDVETASEKVRVMAENTSS